MDSSPKNWNIQEAFVSIPEKIYRTKLHVPYSDAPTDVGFIEAAMWKHTRYILTAWIRWKQGHINMWANLKNLAYEATDEIADHMAEAGLPNLKTILSNHTGNEIVMGRDLIMGKSKEALESYFALKNSDLGDALKAVDWSEILIRNNTSLSVLMGKHSDSMRTYGVMLSSTDSYSKCKPVFKQPELVCLAFGMELGALLDRVVEKYEDKTFESIMEDYVWYLAREITTTYTEIKEDLHLAREGFGRRSDWIYLLVVAGIDKMVAKKVLMMHRMGMGSLFADIIAKKNTLETRKFMRSNANFLGMIKPLINRAGKQGKELTRLWNATMSCLEKAASSYVPGAYSRSSKWVKNDIKICLDYGMKFGALLDHVVKVDLRKKGPAVSITSMMSSSSSDTIGESFMNEDDLKRMKKILYDRYKITVGDMSLGRTKKLLLHEIGLDIRDEVLEEGKGFEKDITDAESYKILINLLDWDDAEIGNFERISGEGNYEALFRKVMWQRFWGYMGIKLKESTREVPVEFWKTHRRPELKKKIAAGNKYDSRLSSSSTTARIESQFWN